MVADVAGEEGYFEELDAFLNSLTRSSTSGGASGSGGGDDEGEIEGKGRGKGTVAELRAALKERGLPVAGRKADLIARLATGEEER